MTKENAENQSHISLRNVCKHYEDGNVVALDGVSLEIESGTFVSVMGPSGCGKSTMLNMIGALDNPTSGEVFLAGNPLHALGDLDRVRSQEIGFVFQSYYLLPNLTAIENVQIPMFESELPRQHRAARAQELLTLVGLADRIKHLPNQLSIGQRQRVAIARAMANEPSLILADEPTGALDSKSGQEVMTLLKELNRTQETTLVMVTHDQNVADQADRTIHLSDGRIVG